MQQRPGFPGEEAAEQEAYRVHHEPSDRIATGRQIAGESLDSDVTAAGLNEGGRQKSAADEQEDGRLILPIGCSVEEIARRDAVA